MKDRYPEIETGVKIIDLDNVMVRAGERILSEPTILFADSTVFDVFTLPFITGNPRTALSRPNTVVLTQAGAAKYFGTENPLGKSMEMDLPYFGKTHLEVTGVIQDIPDNSHFHFDLLGSLVSFPGFIGSDGWSDNNFISYFLLKPGASPKELEAKFTDYVIESFGAENYEKSIAAGNSWDFFLQPLTTIHLKSDLNGEFEPNGNIRNVYLFSIIAFFVLIIACFNFMNLSTAKSVRRAREVGMRKVVGSTRAQLIFQFLGESLILAFTALFLGVLCVKLILPTFSDWLGRDLTFGLTDQPWLFISLAAMTLVIGTLAGLYPAFVLSSFRPVKVLKAQTASDRQGASFRNILVIIQFSATIFLIIGTLIVNRQLLFIQNSDVGFNRNNVLIIRTPSAFSPVSAAYKESIKNNSAIESVSVSSSLPGFGFINLGFGAEGIDRSFTLNVISCDPDYQQTIGLTLAEGRFLSVDYPTDSSGIVLNETAVRILGLENPLGRKMHTYGGRNFNIIGVIRDFNYESVRSEIRPIGLVYQNGVLDQPAEYLAIRFKPGREEEIRLLAGESWENLMPGTPFRYSYFSDDYLQIYRNEVQTSQVFTLLALLTLVVAVLGLIGLASYIAQQRTREIAVRKVFGAGLASIMGLLTWRFVRLILIAFIIASPFAWWILSRWLQNFVYHVPLTALLFIWAGFIALIIAVVTVNVAIFRVAAANPAEGLKYE